MSERDQKPDLISDPDIARALAIFSGAKAEAESLVPGQDDDSLQRRMELQSRLTRDLIERNVLGPKDGKSSADREVPEATEVAL